MQAAEAVWLSYQTHGPGHVAADLHEPVELAATKTRAFLDAEPVDLGGAEAALRQSVDQLVDLSHRFAHTSLGLCFVTGEAGLIPRPDQHRAFETALSTVRDCVAELQQ